MTSRCKYHNLEVATWRCDHCKVNYCKQCVVLKPEQLIPQCMLCTKSLQSLSVSKSLPSLFQNLLGLLAVSVKRPVVLFVFVFAITFSILPKSALGLVFLAIFSVPVIELAFEIMERIAAGERLKQSLSSLLSSKNKNQSIQFALMSAFTLYVVYQLMQSLPTFAFVLIALLLFSIPAGLIILMMEKSSVAMVNPIKIGFIIKTFKANYLFLLMLLAAMGVIAYQQLSRQQSLVMETAGWFSVFYLLYSFSACAGYLVYLYHKELNFGVDKRSLINLAQDPVVQCLNEVDIFLHEGRLEEAQTKLILFDQEQTFSRRVKEKLILLLAVRGQNHFHNMALDYFHYLVSNQQLQRGASFLVKLESREYHLNLPADLLLALLPELQCHQHFGLLLKLVDRYLKTSPLAKGWEELTFIKAKVLAEYLDDLDQAKSLLRLIVKRSVDQAKIEQADNYLKVVCS
ncbi:B-box zinc finger protein [Aliikangiella sp. IMCC44653]